MRQIAQQVLRERGEVESFLIESLHHVVGQIEKIKHPRKAPKSVSSSLGGRTSLPPISRLPALAMSPSWPEVTPSKRGSRSVDQEMLVTQNVNINDEKDLPLMDSLAQVPIRVAPKRDISELTWEEKEHVLRVLFQKMHGAQISKFTLFQMCI